MKYARDFVTSAFVGGVLILVPVYLAVVLLLKGMKSVGGLVRPLAALLPDWIPAEGFFSLLLVLTICFLVGVAVRTRSGRAIRERMEIAFFERLPGYGLLRSLTQRLAGDSEESAWTPALVEIEEALVPAFIIERHGCDEEYGYAQQDDVDDVPQVVDDDGALTTQGFHRPGQLAAYFRDCVTALGGRPLERGQPLRLVVAQQSVAFRGKRADNRADRQFPLDGKGLHHQGSLPTHFVTDDPPLVQDERRHAFGG